MSEEITIKPRKNHVEHRIALLRFYRKQRGETKTTKGYRIPLTLRRDIVQLVKWWDAEYRRARARKPWHRDADQRLWEQAKRKLDSDLDGADPDEVYPDNDWFWNEALAKLAIYLEILKTTPSPTQLLIDSFKETIAERVDDARTFVNDAGQTVGNFADSIDDAAETLADATEKAWSGLKTAAVVGACLFGAAIIVPPIVRAVRN